MNNEKDSGAILTIRGEYRKKFKDHFDLPNHLQHVSINNDVKKVNYECSACGETKSHVLIFKTTTKCETCLFLCDACHVKHGSKVGMIGIERLKDLSRTIQKGEAR